MKVLCFKCYCAFDSIQELSTHFRLLHGLTSNDVYSCMFTDCYQPFSCLSSFKRHLKKHFKNNDSVKSTDSPTPSSSQANLKKNSNVSLSSSPKYTSISEEMSCQTSSNSDYTSCKDSILHICKKISINLHTKNNLTRKDVLSIQQDIAEITFKISESIKSKVIDMIPKADQNNLIDFLKYCENPFEDIRSEYKLFQHIENSDQFAKPEIFTVSNEISEIILKGQPTLDASNVKGCIMPIEFQVRKFFELPDVLTKTLNNIKFLSAETDITHFVNSSCFKEKLNHYKGKTIIPFFLYLDDFEINNPLGSHATVDSVCGVYYSFPTIPQHLLSNLNFIFVAAYFKTKEKKIYGNDPFLRPLIKIFKSLEEKGVSIKTKDGSHQIYFVLSTVVGDNLGLNEILGFTNSFNSLYYCRFCTREKSDMQIDCVEFPNFLRNEQNYNIALTKNDSKQTGILSACLLNNLPTFHVTKNFAVDICHDLFEGVCRYDVCEILLHFILKLKLFSIEVFNYRKQMFNYGETEIGNLSPPIEIVHLKANKVKMSAREMMTFTHFLPLIIGDLIPPDNEVWKFFLNLLKIVDAVLLGRFNSNDLKILAKNIETHNSKYTTLFKKPLKPKFHFLNHYVGILKQIGPLKHIWTFRYESKHREAKMYARNISSRKNITYTLSIKASLKFANFLTEYKDGFPNELHYIESDCYYLHMNEIKLNIVNYESIKYKFPKLLAAKSFVYKGTLYKKDYFLTIKNKFKVELYEIKELLLDNSQEAYVLVQEYKIEKYSEHYQSYLVNSKFDFYKIIDLKLFTSPPIHLYYISDGSALIRNKMF